MLKLSDLIINPSKTLRTALQRMTQNRRGVLFVCDEDGHLVGALSDGDVRRTLLDNTLLISPVEKVMNTDPVSASTVQEATELLRRMNIVAVPVVDKEGKILEAVVEDRDSVLVITGETPGAASGRSLDVGVVALIPARGGSKRIPRKNLANVAGKSLLAWAIDAAKGAHQVSHVVLSTDDMEIAEAARALGIDVPWMRPSGLSTDTVPTLDVITHALKWAVRNLTPVPEYGVLLEPTAPFRKPGQIDEAISLLVNSDADCVASVCELPHVFHPEEVLVVEQDLLGPYSRGRTMDSRRLRNDQRAVYVLNGLVYAFRIHTVLSGAGLFGRKTMPMVTPWEDFLDIDTPADLELATFKMGRCLSHA